MQSIWAAHVFPVHLKDMYCCWCVTVMAEHLSASSIRSLYNNIIGVEGAMAVAEAMKTTTNLQKL